MRRALRSFKNSGLAALTRACSSAFSLAITSLITGLFPVPVGIETIAHMCNGMTVVRLHFEPGSLRNGGSYSRERQHCRHVNGYVAGVGDTLDQSWCHERSAHNGKAGGIGAYGNRGHWTEWGLRLLGMKLLCTAVNREGRSLVASIAVVSALVIVRHSASPFRSDAITRPVDTIGALQSLICGSHYLESRLRIRTS